MLAFLPVDPPPHAGGVRLDVRVGTGRAVSFTLGDGEFLLGGAAACDLRLPGPQTPPVVCQFTRSADGVRVRKLSPTVPVVVNDRPLSGSAPVAVHDGDHVQAGPAEIRVHVSDGAFLTPKLTIFEDDIPTAKPLPAADDDLARERAELAEQARELEEERAIWYRRKMEMQAELQGVPDADGLLRREAAVAAKERELQHEYDRRFAALTQEVERRRAEVDAELAARRERAEAESADRMRTIEEEIGRRRAQFEADLREYEPRLVELQLVRERLTLAQEDIDKQQLGLKTARDELRRERTALDDERQWQTARLKELDDALLRRHEELSRREEQLRRDRDGLTSERDRHKDDLVRLDRWQAALESKQTELAGRAAEVNERFDLMHRHAGEWEDTVRLADAEQTRIRAEADRLEKLRTELDQQAAALADRGAMLESQQAALAMLRANLARQQETIQQESAALTAERLRFEEHRRELENTVREAESVRAELGTIRDDQVHEHRVTAERNTLLAATIEEHRAAEERLRQKELELDERSSQFAEQAALLKARLQQAVELQERLELDRAAVKAREAALSETDAARLAFQEQLRKRSEELSLRAREVDELRVKLAEEQAVMDRLRQTLDGEKAREEQRLGASREELAARAKEVEDRAAALAEREATLARQVARLKEVGETVAQERKALAEARAQFDADTTAAAQTQLTSQHETEAVRARVAAHFAELRAQAPNLDELAKASLDRLAAARDVLRGNLGELHDYARQTREELDAVRSQLRADAEQLRQREYDIESARSEHRLAVTGFRQQLLDWQSKVGELRNQFTAAEARIDQRQAEVETVEKQLLDARDDLAKQTQEIAAERRKAGEKRAEMERHLGDMREWYRRKLRELAAGRQVDESDMPKFGDERRPDVLPLSTPIAEPPAEPEPGDQQLGDLLKSRGLVDENTLQALWAEARRQRKTLRQTLLASGALTLYQLAIIEAGNLDGLMLGRLRVVDRLRATSKETAYRVFDPTRPGGPTRGVYVLRHLSETEMQDAVHPDEFRQRFAAMAAAAHPNLANTLEVLEVNKRPAALQEWVGGLGSADWPPVAALPGVWLRLMNDAAKAVHHAHRAGLVHGRLASDSFVLTADGTLKVLGFGEPLWLAGGTQTVEPPPAADLRALGQLGFLWSQLGSRRRGTRTKPFPAELTTVIRRLEIGAEPPMGDVVAIDRPYADTGDLLRDLARLMESHPCPADAWEKLVRFAADNAPDQPQPLRATG
jgi:chromosome segregation ATPase